MVLWTRLNTGELLPLLLFSLPALYATSGISTSKFRQSPLVTALEGSPWLSSTLQSFLSSTEAQKSFRKVCALSDSIFVPVWWPGP